MMNVDLNHSCLWESRGTTEIANHKGGRTVQRYRDNRPNMKEPDHWRNEHLRKRMTLGKGDAKLVTYIINFRSCMEMRSV